MSYINHCKDCRFFDAGDCQAPEITDFARLVSGLTSSAVLIHTAFDMRASESLCGLYAHWFEKKEDDEDED